MQHVNDTDYDFITLKQRHAALIPSGFDPGSGATLKYYNYPEALELGRPRNP